MKKYIIITGANGYLGKYIILDAIRRDYHIIAFRYDHIRSTVIDHPNVEYIHCDITKNIQEQEGIQDIIQNKTIVGIINAAALLGSSDFEDNNRVNCIGVEKMMNFARELKIKKFVQISSVVVLKKIKGPYGVTKLNGQEILINSELDYTVFIPAMILGPESLGLNRILKNVFRFPFLIPLIGNGQQTQHPIFVKDFAKYIVESVENPNASRKTYEIGGDTIITFKDFIRLILKLKNKHKIFIPIPVFVADLLGRFFQATQKVPVFTAEHVKGILQDSRLNTKLLKEDLNFEPTPLIQAMSFCLDEVGNNWDKYLGVISEKKTEA